MLLCGAAAPLDAAAQDAAGHDPAHATAAARALFEDGVACADHADWACAVERFGRARSLRPSPVIVSNHAIALAHVGRLVEASEAYRQLARDPSAPADLRASAERAIPSLTSRIGRITVRPSGPVEDVAIEMDGHILEASLIGIPVPSDPGDHLVEARREGTVVASAHVHLDTAGSQIVELTIPEAPRPVVARPLPAPTDPAERADHLGAVALVADAPQHTEHHEIYEEWWLWTIVGVVVVGAGVGITAGAIASEGTTLPRGSLGTIDGRP